MSSTRKQLIDLLNESKDQYVSGQKLAESLNLSRNAIWKHMKDLEEDGFQIEAKQGLGYRVVGVPDQVSDNTILWGLQTKWLGNSISYKPSLGSTQVLAHQLAQAGAEHGTVVLCNEQTAGRARMDRQWDSKNKDGLWFSIILRPQIPPYLAPQLTLLTATVLADVVEHMTQLQPQIKWPNDLLIRKKKISGILTEMQAEQDQILYVIVGIGINLNQKMTDFQEEIQDRVTSLYEETDKKWEQVKFLQKLLETFEVSYEKYIGEGFANVKEKWESYGFRIGEKIKIKTANQAWESTFLGIAEDGALRIMDEGNQEKKLYSGEIQWFD